MTTSLVALSILWSPVGEAQTPPGTPAARPNIVFILADDLAWNQVGYHGSRFYETPNIDAIAASGMRFTNAYSGGPVCSPTRASLMTGKSPARVRITDYIPGSPYPYAILKTPYRIDGLPLEEITIAEMLKSRGYFTGHFGKWHLGKDYNYAPNRAGDPASQGFDEVLTNNKPEDDAPPATWDAHHSIATTERALRFIDKHKSGPFFAYVAYQAPHRPLMEQPGLIAKYAAKPGAKDPVNNPTMGAMIERMDTGIGRILARLKRHGLDRNTLVVFYSDNGGLEWLQSQYPYRGGKSTVWDGGLRVPLAVRWTGTIAPRSSNKDLVTSDDFFPTFAELTGVRQLPANLDGVSMLSSLRGRRSNGRDTLFFHYPHYHHLGFRPAGAIRQGKHKLIEWYEGSIAGYGKPYTLYDIEADIDESDDISSKNPKLVAEMAARLKAWRKRVGAGEMTPNPAFEIKRANWRYVNERGGDS